MRVERQSLRDLIQNCGGEHGERHYLEDARSERCVTYDDLARSMLYWSDRLDKAATPVGAPVLLDVEDPLTFASCYLAVIASGRCAVPMDPTTPDGEARRTVTALRPALIMSDHGVRPGLPAIPQFTVTPFAVTPFAVHPLDRDSPTVGPGCGDTVEQRPAGSLRLRTSGSTGEPKVVELSERQLLHVGRAVAAHNHLTARDRGYNALPLFHINAEVVGLLATLTAGSTLVLDTGFHRTGFWKLIEARSITWINAVPAILAILARAPLPAVRPTALRMIRSASAPLPTAVRNQLTEAVGEIVIESYGMTEAASQITATALDQRPPDGSSGQPVGVDLEVRDLDNRPAPVGTIGAIWIRGAGIISGYLDGRCSDRFDVDGWFDTGDLGRVDSTGNLFLAGRADDVINRGGELVYPREIEEVLMGDGRVLDAIAVGRPDEILGSVPVAYVIARERPSSSADQNALITQLNELCVEQLSRFKRPALVTLVDELPRAPTGKVRRHEVKRATSALAGVSAAR